MPSPVEALPCGSRSTISTRFPSSASAAARLIAVVVLPTPPFWLTTARIRGRFGAMGSGTLDRPQFQKPAAFVRAARRVLQLETPSLARLCHFHSPARALEKERRAARGEMPRRQRQQLRQRRPTPGPRRCPPPEAPPARSARPESGFASPARALPLPGTPPCADRIRCRSPAGPTPPRPPESRSPDRETRRRCPDPANAPRSRRQRRKVAGCPRYAGARTRPGWPC